MKVLSLIAATMFLIPTLSGAKEVTIDSKIYFAGKKIGSPRISNSVGEKSKVVLNDPKSKREFSLEIKTKEITKSVYKVNYILSVREKNNEILNRGFVRISEKSQGRILIDRSRIELRFKLGSVDNVKAYVSN